MGGKYTYNPPPDEDDDPPLPMEGIRNWNLDWTPPCEKEIDGIRIEPEGFWGPRYTGKAQVKHTGIGNLEFTGLTSLKCYYPWWKRLVKFLFRR